MTNNSKNQISFTNLDKQWIDIRDLALPLIDKILSSGNYLNHDLVSELEQRLADYVGCKEVILVNSGTDALMLSLYALGIGPGDECITVPNSFLASTAAIAHVGATPVMADVGPDHLINPDFIEKLINERTRLILPVHLEGKVCDMESIKKLAEKYSLDIVEDAAQAFGSKLNNKKVGSLSDLTCFSLHPLKNLNACGDGGFIATNSEEVASKIRKYRNHGQSDRNLSENFGVVSRFDSIQAAILSVRLNQIDEVIEKRVMNAKIYDELLFESRIITPILSDNVFHSYHLYVIEIENRDKIAKDLSTLGIHTRVHYPKLITDQVAYHAKYKSYVTPIADYQKKRILSLPIHTSLTRNDIAYVCETLIELDAKYNGFDV